MCLREAESQSPILNLTGYPWPPKKQAGGAEVGQPKDRADPKAPVCQVQRGLESICPTSSALLPPDPHQTQARKSFKSPASTLSIWHRTPSAAFLRCQNVLMLQKYFIQI